MSIHKFTPVVIVIGVALLISAPSSASSRGGTITFTGEITEAGCNIEHDKRAIHIKCYRNGKNIKVTAPLNAPKTVFPQGSVSGVKWLDSHRKLGIMSVTYQ